MELARESRQILVIFSNHEGSGYEFASFGEPNIKVFINNDDLLNVAALMRRLDLLLSADTGNVHLADNLGVSILELIHAKNAYRWGAGAYGNKCEMLILPNDWERNYERYKDTYFHKAKAWARKLLDERQ